MNETEALVSLAKTLAESQKPDRDKEDDDIILKQLASIDGIDEYLQRMMGTDLHQYFSAEDPNNQLLIKGSFRRAAYLLGKIHQIRLT